MMRSRTSIPPIPGMKRSSNTISGWRRKTSLRPSSGSEAHNTSRPSKDNKSRTRFRLSSSSSIATNVTGGSVSSATQQNLKSPRSLIIADAGLRDVFRAFEQDANLGPQSRHIDWLGNVGIKSVRQGALSIAGHRERRDRGHGQI